MCCLFGIVDYGGILSSQEKKKVLSVLLSEAEERGTDASGIAYVKDRRLSIYKRPVAGHLLKPRIPNECRSIIGHTRMTTQGSEKFNFNNHPFRGSVGNTSFALAHNGVLYNDFELQEELRLPKAQIQTDSYIAVQLLEREKKLELDSIGHMAEKLLGSYAFSILDERENLYLVKGSCPLCVRLYAEKGVIIYASMREAVQRAAAAIRLSKKHGRDIPIRSGEILKITPSGALSRSSFAMQDDLWDDVYMYCGFNSRGFGTHHSTAKSGDSPYIAQLKSFAAGRGYPPEDIDRFMKEGFSIMEIEDMIYETYYTDYCF